MGTRLRTVLLGPPGTVRDLVGAVLALDGFTVEGPGPDLADLADLSDLSGGDAPGAVVVAVTPGPADWEVLSRRGGGIVLVAERGLSDDEVLEAVLRGVDAVVTTDTSPVELGRVVEAVGRGETLLCPTQARRLATAARSAAHPGAARRLTSREVAILRSIERGESVKQTARALGIATKTVENLQSRLFRKLGARNRAHAVTLARGLGLFEPVGAGLPGGSGPWPPGW